MNPVEQDIWNWLTDYVEVNHKFYDYRFPPCPFAKAARLAGLVSMDAYDSGNVKQFITQSIDKFLCEKTHDVKIMVMPPRAKWTWGMNKFIADTNADLVPQDFYVQFGIAIKTQSRYVGFMNKGPYFIAIVNRLSNVLKGHESLLKTDYYNFWDKFHYDAVVVRRQQAVEKYKSK